VAKTIWIINQYASTPETGMGGRHYYLSKELAKQGHKVFLIAAGYTHLLRYPPKIKRRFKVEFIDGFRFVWVSMPEYQGAHDKKRVWNWIDFARKILNISKVITERPDVILYSSPSLIPFISAQRLAKKTGAKLAFEVRDIWPLSLVEIGGYSIKHPFIRLLQWIEDKAYRESDIVLSNLPNAEKHMIQRGMAREKFEWIPNGFDLEEVSQAEPIPDKVLGMLPKDKFIIGYTGTLGAANALGTFIEAAAITKDNDSLAWVLVGKGKEKKRLQAKSKKLRLNNLYFIDAIPKKQIQTMLSKFDICYIGLTKDPLFRFGVSPNKLFDYLYGGKSILYAIDSAEYEPVTEAHAGLSVPAEDPQAVVEAVLKIENMSVEQRAQFGQNGREYVLKNHDYTRLAEKLATVLLDE